MANSGDTDDRQEGAGTGFEAKHAAIIGRTLRWADDAAARRDYAQAVRWVETVRALGPDLPDEYKRKHENWLYAMKLERRTRGG
jgi:hypothetical protein